MLNIEENLRIIEGFINYYSSNEYERNLLKKIAKDYIEEDHADGKDSDNYNEEIHQTRYKDLEYEYIDEFGNSHIKYVTIYINSNNNGEITSITE